MDTLAHTTVQSSELSREPRVVFAAAERGPVDVTRRDGSTLVLRTKEQDDLRTRVFELAAQLIAVSLDERESLVDRLAVPFPWIKLLSEGDQATCAAEIIATARGAFAIDRPERIVTEIAAWRSTAEAVAAGWGTDSVEWVDDDIEIGRPSA
ncbi:prevent-host-death protein [Homoserinibacter sp. YIM 151385]|uniref:prevent-host-death protein n=1 Tax=Homoserinibacter sp. YIM 151385 TaxID=2985506 RepID=UPI0022F137F6|nr:prevent-host-death protein [Homoserinibacter sp. YIM 151385]WBU36740.1 prevent-host-death protein [Homoserinibacter sp. YIM 151385]